MWLIHETFLFPKLSLAENEVPLRHSKKSTTLPKCK